MTARTHDLAAFTTLTLALVYGTAPPMTLATALVALGANFLGGLFPDIDESSSKFWESIRGGRIIGKIIPPLIGGHRYITHSLIGVMLAGFLLKHLLAVVGNVVLVDMNVVWWAFMLGMWSHLLTDSITKEGVLWLFPLPYRIGFPPFKSMRIRTGGMVEKAIFFPALVLLNGYLIWQNYPLLLQLFRGWLEKPY
jgi:inner membrane protein